MSGYAATLLSTVKGNRLGSFPGTVEIQACDAQYPLLQVSGCTADGVIRLNLMPVLNHTDASLRGFLKEFLELRSSIL